MAMQLKQELKLVQKLILTPQLQQAIKLLQLTRMELSEQVNQELNENPVLEEVQDGEDSQEEQDNQEEGDKYKNDDLNVESLLKSMESSDNWENYPTSYSGSFADSGEKQHFIENTYAKKTSLLDHLLWQLRMNSLTEEEVRVGTIISGNLNDDGYLTITIEEVAEKGGCDQSTALEILKKIQLFDPVGVASRDLKECLKVQAKSYNITNPVVSAVIDQYLPKLLNRNFTFISKKLHVSKDAILEAVEIISALEPKPGRPFITEEPHYIIPDVYVFKFDNEYVVKLNNTGLPKLRLSNFYKKILIDGKNTPDSTKDFIKERINSATWLIKSIQQRQKTIYKVSKSIVSHQVDFLDKGTKYLKPLILRDVAEDVEVHESTVSRVTNGKYMHTPRGVFELKYFFTSRVATSSDEDKSMVSVKSRIKEIISDEDPKKPITDKQIMGVLEKEGVFLARRTVAKYREMMSILSSAGRKEG